MFTGLVEAIGTLRAASGDSPRRLTVASAIPPAEVRLGDSVAIDGCCLTCVARGSDDLTFEAATETLRRTTIGSLKSGDRVHMERSLALGGRLDGHLVMGHVDGLGVLRVREQRGSALYLGIEAPEEVARLTSPRGSIAIAGVSLTVTDVGDRVIYVGLIPHTLSVTKLGDLRLGDGINLEADMIARYVDRVLAARRGEPRPNPQQPSSLTAEWLKDKGFL